jgi:hypothetical protein
MNRLVEFVALGKAPSLSFRFPFREIDGQIINAKHPCVHTFALAPGYLPTRHRSRDGHPWH